jgi:ornithine decarboxylase
MVMPTVVSDRFAPLDYTDYTNNPVFLKSCNNGVFDYHQHGHHAHHDGPRVNPSAKELIGNALRERVESIDHEFCEAGEEDTFFVADLGEVYRQHLRWKLNLPRVKPFYGKNSMHCSNLDFLLTFSSSRQVQLGLEAPGAAVRSRHWLRLRF